MINLLLTPVITLMQRLKLLPKFVLLLAVFAIPLALTTTLLMHELRKSIVQTEEERIGIQHLQTMQAAIEQAQRLRASRHMAVMGNASAKADAERMQGELDKKMTALQDAPHSAAQLYPAAEWETLRTSWQTLQAKLHLADRKHYADYSDFIRQLHTLQNLIADRSHLTNDPEVSTYYLAMLVARDTPRIVEGLMEIAGRGAAYIDSGLLEANEDGLLGSIVLVTTRDIAEVKDQLDALKNNGVVESSLNPIAAAMSKAQLFIQRARNEVLSSVDQTSGAQFMQAGGESVQAINAASSTLATALDRLLAERIVRDTRHGITIMSAIAAVLLIAGYVLSGFYRSFSHDMQRLHAVIQHVAQGNLAHRTQATGRDELAQLLDACGAMRDSLTDMVRHVRHSSDTIAVASQEIASGNLNLSMRTEEQASSLEQTSAAMTELTQTVRQNAARAQQASKLAQSASEVAGQGGALVMQAVTTMSAIRQSSRKIGDIVGVVDSIAFQTNILALNAAVEAARAGPEGRGFAVVAAEVRNLAQRSAVAAAEIKGLISASESNVASGSSQVDQAGQTMTEIVQSIRDVTSFMEQIADASEEQQRGIEHINQALVQMDDITQQNAALVEEAAAAAESMREQATTLTRTVAVFRLGDQLSPMPLAETGRMKEGRLIRLPVRDTQDKREQSHTLLDRRKRSAGKVPAIVNG